MELLEPFEGADGTKTQTLSIAKSRNVLLSQLPSLKSSAPKIMSTNQNNQLCSTMSSIGIEENARLQAAWEESMKDDGDLGLRNRHCTVLMISWDAELDDLQTSDEVNRLGGVFCSLLNYTVVKRRIMAGKQPSIQVQKFLVDIVHEYDDDNTLLIIYYAGHGIPGKPGELQLAGSRMESRGEATSSRHTVLWHTVEPIIKSTASNVLVIFDCCHAGQLGEQPKMRGSFSHRSFEFLGACQPDGQTPMPGRRSFTSALIWALEELVQTRGIFTTLELMVMVTRYPDFPDDQTPYLSERGEPSVNRLVLAPLTKPGESGRNEKSKRSSKVDVSGSFKDYIDLRFFFKEKPDSKVIVQLADGLKRLVQNQKIGAQKIRWLGTGRLEQDKIKEVARIWLNRARRSRTESESAGPIASKPPEAPRLQLLTPPESVAGRSPVGRKSSVSDSETTSVTSERPENVLESENGTYLNNHNHTNEDSVSSEAESDIFEEESHMDVDEDSEDLELGKDDLSHSSTSNIVTNKLSESANQDILWRLVTALWGWTAMLYTPSATTYAGTGPSSSTTKNGPMSSTHATPTRSSTLKRPRDDDEEPPEDQEDREPKRLKHNRQLPDPDTILKLACPFRKHDPTKYGIDSPFSCCALKHWPKVARVKEHIYRRHLKPVQCPRCWDAFENEADRDTHLNVPKMDMCDDRPASPMDGITPEIERQLKSRKRPSRNPSEEELWRKMFKCILPGETVPESPYFDPIVDDSSSQIFSDFQAFSRQEFPRLARHSLETRLNDLIPGLEDNFRNRIFNIMLECQEDLFSIFPTRNSIGPESPRIHALALHRPMVTRGIEAGSSQTRAIYLPNADHLRTPPPPNVFHSLPHSAYQDQLSVFQGELSGSISVSNPQRNERHRTEDHGVSMLLTNSTATSQDQLQTPETQYPPLNTDNEPGNELMGDWEVSPSIQNFLADANVDWEAMGAENEMFSTFDQMPIP